MLRRCFAVSFAALSIVLASCNSPATSPQPAPSPTASPTATLVEIGSLTEKDTVGREITQRKDFNQCDSASPFKAQIQFSQSSEQGTQDKLVIGAEVGGQVGMSELAKATIKAAIEKHFTASRTDALGHNEGVQLEVPARTHQEYTIVWRETKRTGTIAYVEGHKQATTDFSYRIGLELVSAMGRDILCPGQSIEASRTPSPSQLSPTPLPTSTPYPTPPPTAPVVPVATATSAPLPTAVPVPSPTPILDTPAGTVLPLGETWRQNGMTMRVSDFELTSFKCSNGFNEWPVWGIWHIVVSNETRSDLVVQMSQKEFYLKDDAGKGADFYLLTEDATNCFVNPFYGTDGVDVKLIKAGEKVRFRALGKGAIGSVKSYVFGATEAGRIKNASWLLKVPR